MSFHDERTAIGGETSGTWTVWGDDMLVCQLSNVAIFRNAD